MRAGSKAEWNSLKSVIMHNPGPEIFFHSLLNQKIKNHSSLSEMLVMHDQIVGLLKDNFGIRVNLVDGLIRDIPVSKDSELYSKLLNIALESISILSDSDQKNSSARIPEQMDPYSLFLLALYSPAIRYHKDRAVSIELNRIMEGLMRMNDYYLTAPEGLIMGAGNSPEKANETLLAEIVLNATGVRPDFKITAGTATGGDIIPAGDFILIGCGSRTSIEGIMQLISVANLHKEIVIVHEPVHPLLGSRDPLLSGHLDTYLNFPGGGLAIGDPVMLKSAQVEVFHKESSGYHRSENAGNLLEYLRTKSIDLIELNTLEQLCNATGFLCVYEGECVSENLNEKAPLILKKIQDISALHEGRYMALLNRAEHDYRQMRNDGSRIMDREFLSDYGVEFFYTSGKGALGHTSGVRRLVGIVSRR